VTAQAGMWNFDGEPIDQELLTQFGHTLTPCGPDGESSYVDGSVALLCRPFHTTRESRCEKQPYISARGFVITWDGRLDNRDCILAKMGHRSGDDRTDVDIFAACFDRWEKDCFRHITGDWAASIWQPERRELILACDFMCIRHIFYYLNDRRISWATELNPLVRLSRDRFHLDDDYIAGYFSSDPDSRLTPYREIRQVPAGSSVRVRHETVVIGRYWPVNTTLRIRYKSDAEYEEHFRYVFRQSVRRRLRSDSPILAELSGGLDSSSIVCMADHLLSEDRGLTPRLDTLSLCDKTEPNGDDWNYLRIIEDKRGRSGAHIDASKYGESATFSDSAFCALPGRVGAGREIDEARDAVMRQGRYRVVLSGIGGDEFLGGIPNPASQLAELFIQLKLVRLGRQLMEWSLVKRRPWAHLLWDGVKELLPLWAKQNAACLRVQPWIKEEFAKRTKRTCQSLTIDERSWFSSPTRRSCMRGVHLMANKMAKRTSSRSTTEETRYPYLDRDLIEFILSIPAQQLLRPGDRRSLMRRSLATVVPQEILSRRTKQFGARTPARALALHLDQIRQLFEPSLSSQMGYIDSACFIEEVSRSGHGKEIPVVGMIRTISLELWIRSLASYLFLESGGDSQRHASSLWI
jgi:asparagine synthase (glutamine-hydrolysing)